MIVLRVLTVEQAQRGISWTTVVLVGGMLSLSTAMVASGAAAQLADRLVDVVGDAGPHALLLGLFLLTATLGQLISQHGHGADRDPGRAVRGGGDGRGGRARPDGGDRLGGGSRS